MTYQVDPEQIFQSRLHLCRNSSKSQEILKKLNITSDCVEWPITRPDGYGYFYVKGKWHYAHIYSYNRYNRPRVESELKLEVMHLCNNPSCINPEHLALATREENMQYMKKTKTNHSKLNQQEVDLVRELYKKGGISIKDLALKFKVGTSTIHRLLTRKTWK